MYETMNETITILRNVHRIAATLEHPGYIAVALPKSTANFGTASGDRWGWDLTSLDGESLAAEASSDIPADSTDAYAIAAWIADALEQVTR